MATTGQMSAASGAQIEGANSERLFAKIMRLCAAVVLVNVALLAPWWVLSGGFSPPWLALEAVAIVALFTSFPPKPWVRYVALAGSVTIMAATIVGFGEAALRLSLGRSLNLYSDIWLLSSVRHLLWGSLGPVLAVAVMVLVSIGLLVVTAALAWLLTSLRIDHRVLSGRLSALGLITFLALGAIAERSPMLGPVLDVPTFRLVRVQASGLADIANQKEWFAEALAKFPESYANQPGLMSGLGGRDVVIGFLESYGVVALYDDRYSPVLGPRLDDLEARVEAAELHMASGRLVAPSQGGQSWFAHGSVLSGIWLDNQIRYDMMLSGGRETLIDDFQRAGYRTVAVMPAITAAWPEGRRFGYDEIFTRDQIDYAGPALNWVTMPDQFTWSFLENTVRASSDQPLFVELGLISSHAPWTPILPVLDDWEEIGDGSRFEEFSQIGERPEDLWRDIDRIREHYALSVDYAVHTMAAYAERYVDDRTLLIVLGDHQPAPLITGDGASWEVPVHVISGDRSLVDPFLEWGFVEGAWPDTDPGLETLGVDYFRDWFIRAYSGS